VFCDGRGSPVPAVFKTGCVKMLATVPDPQLHMCIGAVRKVADYDIPQERAASFLRLHKCVDLFRQPESISPEKR
jgi:hypothetical protein